MTPVDEAASCPHEAWEQYDGWRKCVDCSRDVLIAGVYGDGEADR